MSFEFCPRCDNVLDIAKSAIKKNVDLDATSSDESVDKIEIIIKKLLKDESVDKLIINIRKEQIINHPVFQKLDKEEKKIITDNLNKTKSDTQSSAYYMCKSCSWYQKIKEGTQILSKVGGDDEQNSYLNIDKYKNSANSNVLPYTRNYRCSNDKCPGNTDFNKHEAVMKRVRGTINLVYICCACKKIANI